MSNITNSQIDSKVVLITGAGKRVGASIARYFHQQGMRVIIHYHHSAQEAKILSDQLNQLRPHSALSLQANLQPIENYKDLIENAHAEWNRLDVLINNASSFYPTPIGSINKEDWENLMASNLKAPLFLSQAAAVYLKAQKGCIINLVDIQAQRPMRKYSVYCIAKAGLVMLTKSLAKELAPDIRVNAIAPGIALWPDDETDFKPEIRQKILARVALKRAGTPQDIAEAAYFLIQQQYITGQVLAVDGGLSLDY